jgi:hypothetical protein
MLFRSPVLPSCIVKNHLLNRIFRLKFERGSAEIIDSVSDIRGQVGEILRLAASKFVAQSDKFNFCVQELAFASRNRKRKCSNWLEQLTKPVSAKCTICPVASGFLPNHNPP